MTRTFKTIATVAVICVAAPAFAHGGGHGGTSRGDDLASMTRHDTRTGNTSNTTTREIMRLQTERSHLVQLRMEASLANNQVAVKRLAAQIERLDRLILKKKFGIVVD